MNNYKKLWREAPTVYIKMNFKFEIIQQMNIQEFNVLL